MAVSLCAMRLLGIGAALAVAAQAVLLTWPNPQGMLVGAALGAAILQLWAVRRHLNQHVDMILQMGAYGGLGMLAGGPACHMTLMMWVGMFAAGLPPTLWGSRCIRDTRRQGDVILVVVVDVLGMASGMYVGHLALTTHQILLHHLSMLLGMLLGMALATAIRLRIEAIAGKRRASGPLPARSTGA